MKTEIQEVRISVKDPRHECGDFDAVVRDGGLDSIDNMLEGQFPQMPTTETIKAYIQFLQEVIKAMKED